MKNRTELREKLQSFLDSGIYGENNTAWILEAVLYLLRESDVSDHNA